MKNQFFEKSENHKKPPTYTYLFRSLFVNQTLGLDRLFETRVVGQQSLLQPQAQGNVVDEDTAQAFAESWLFVASEAVPLQGVH